MVVPSNVQNYLDADWWLTTHVGLPLALIMFILGVIVMAYIHYMELHEDDEPTEPRAGKTLGL